MIVFNVSTDRLSEALKTLKKLSTEIDTVFSLAVTNLVDGDGNIPYLSIAQEVGFLPRPHPKTHVGLWRPLN
ncbi:MAG: hypothetical protein AMK69_18270 [Nitrospira bacterium SG8_3]|nr:MAG: hypothetical protein AMK69_18270 [Nitrospira bacterium SG8_3]